VNPWQDWDLELISLHPQKYLKECILANWKLGGELKSLLACDKIMLFFQPEVDSDNGKCINKNNTHIH
jgi:hypothetical protein